LIKTATGGSLADGISETLQDGPEGKKKRGGGINKKRTANRPDSRSGNRNGGQEGCRSVLSTTDESHNKIACSSPPRGGAGELRPREEKDPTTLSSGRGSNKEQPEGGGKKEGKPRPGPPGFGIGRG